jgi:tRNA G18 (ribose-2'-O)-methylase SpoU
VIPLDSADDPLLADYRLIASPDELRRRGLFVVEGRLVVRRLLEAPRFRTRSILLTRVAWEWLRDAVDGGGSSAPVYVIPQERMNELVGFNIHRGCLALVERPVVPLLADLDVTRCSRVLVLEGVNNPDNVGGLFRNAAAFGVELVVLGPNCGDPFYRKAIRTSMGATLSVPIADAGAWPDAIDRLRAAGLQVIALTPAHTAAQLSSMPMIARLALLLGAEGDGLSIGALQSTDTHVRIEMTTAVDSLNVATAAAIALHHFTRPVPP